MDGSEGESVKSSPVRGSGISYLLTQRKSTVARIDNIDRLSASSFILSQQLLGLA